MRWNKRVQYYLDHEGWEPLRPHEMVRRSWRRHQAERHMWRRLKEDRNQHYDDLKCPCWTDAREMARFKEQPKGQCKCCVNPRYHHGWPTFSRLTLQELRAADSAAAQPWDYWVELNDG